MRQMQHKVVSPLVPCMPELLSGFQAQILSHAGTQGQLDLKQV